MFGDNALGGFQSDEPVHYILPQLFPLLSAFFGLGAFVSGYVIGVLNDHEEKWFSYISDGGAVVPESCIFGILLNVSTFFWFLTCYCRHIQLRQYLQFYFGRNTYFTVFTYPLLFFGFLSGIGSLFVANFQEGAVGIAHGLGAFASFIGGMFYIWFYILVSACVNPRFVPRCMTIFRFVMALIVTAALILHEICNLSKAFVKRSSGGVLPSKPKPPSNGVFRYQPGDAYYTNHLVAALAEWIMCVGFFVVIATLFCELRSFKVGTISNETERKRKLNSC